MVTIDFEDKQSCFFYLFSIFFIIKRIISFDLGIALLIPLARNFHATAATLLFCAVQKVTKPL